MNKNLIPNLVIALVAVAITLGGTIWAVNAFSFKVGVVDLNQVIKDSKLGQTISGQINAKGRELTLQQNQAKTQDEKLAINNEFAKYNTDKQKEFLDKAKVAIAKVAKQNGVKGVEFGQQYYSEIDLTKNVIKELNK